MTGLVEAWQILQPRRGQLVFLVRLLDLDVAFSKLPLDIKRAVLVMGYAQMPSREAGLVLGVSYSTVLRRYRQGLDDLVTYMNGNEGVDTAEATA